MVRALEQQAEVALELAVVGGEDDDGVLPFAGSFELGKDATLLINLSGRGDKDVQTAAEYFGLPL